MNCPYCQHLNSEDEPRCLRCGRRLVEETRPVTGGYRTAQAVALAGATPLHRAVGVALDLSLIVIAFAAFLLTFHLCGGDVEADPLSFVLYGGALALIGLFYGLLHVLGDADTPGRRWVGLRLINFDGC